MNCSYKSPEEVDSELASLFQQFGAPVLDETSSDSASELKQEILTKY